MSERTETAIGTGGAIVRALAALVIFAACLLWLPNVIETFWLDSLVWSDQLMAWAQQTWFSMPFEIRMFFVILMAGFVVKGKWL